MSKKRSLILDDILQIKKKRLNIEQYIISLVSDTESKVWR